MLLSASITPPPALGCVPAEVPAGADVFAAPLVDAGADAMRVCAAAFSFSYADSRSTVCS